jgi:hypothetical protein
MNTLWKILKTIYWFITALALLLACGVATYAWFTNNRVVETDSVTSRSGSDTVELQLSSDGATFSQEVGLTQVNTLELEQLMPVSTADLQSFVYCPSTQADLATQFALVEEEQYYYHGRIYLRAYAEGDHSGARMALYLDQGSEAGGNIAQAASGDLLSAARLGLSFQGGDSVIFSLSEEATGNQVRNTMLGGSLLSDGQVLGYSGGAVQATQDPSVSLEQYTISLEGDTVSLPETPITYLELNQVYTLDVYFYLEGCDPDCSDSISYDGADLHLAFYGILTEEGGT